MFPISDINKTKRYPFVNTALIVINVMILFYELGMTQEQFTVFLGDYALVPAAVMVNFMEGSFLAALYPFVTNTFLHGGLSHLVSNMWFLYIFGDNVEDRFGHFTYLLIYLFFGFLASMVQVFAEPSSLIPIVGASGAIGGVLGAYYMFFPGAQVMTWLPPFFFFPLPANIYIIIWFGIQMFNAGFGIFSSGASDIAWWAHIGGFAAGVLAAKIFLQVKGKNREYYYYSDR